jgi:hypothetical protein
VARIHLRPGRPQCARAFNALAEGGGVGVMSPGHPRVRRRIARGGARPSSEAECCPRGCQPLERGGESQLVGWWAVMVSLSRGPS